MEVNASARSVERRSLRRAAARPDRAPRRSSTPTIASGTPSAAPSAASSTASVTSWRAVAAASRPGPREPPAPLAARAACASIRLAVLASAMTSSSPTAPKQDPQRPLRVADDVVLQPVERHVGRVCPFAVLARELARDRAHVAGAPARGSRRRGGGPPRSSCAPCARCRPACARGIRTSAPSGRRSPPASRRSPCMVPRRCAGGRARPAAEDARARNHVRPRPPAARPAPTPRPKTRARAPARRQDAEEVAPHPGQAGARRLRSTGDRTMVDPYWASASKLPPSSRRSREFGSVNGIGRRFWSSSRSATMRSASA